MRYNKKLMNNIIVGIAVSYVLMVLVLYAAKVIKYNVVNIVKIALPVFILLCIGGIVSLVYELKKYTQYEKTRCIAVEDRCEKQFSENSEKFEQTSSDSTKTEESKEYVQPSESVVGDVLPSSDSTKAEELEKSVQLSKSVADGVPQDDDPLYKCKEDILKLIEEYHTKLEEMQIRIDKSLLYREGIVDKLLEEMRLSVVTGDIIASFNGMYNSTKACETLMKEYYVSVGKYLRYKDNFTAGVVNDRKTLDALKNESSKLNTDIKVQLEVLKHGYVGIDFAISSLENEKICELYNEYKDCVYKIRTCNVVLETLLCTSYYMKEKLYEKYGVDEETKPNLAGHQEKVEVEKGLTVGDHEISTVFNQDRICRS
ncbi:MAG: hypothetical protein ACTJLM_04835 [Ehrlichia sp.]